MLGGPFSFLAGLFCLGTAGAMKVVEDAQVRERYREFNSKKRLPYGLQQRMIYSAYKLRKDYGGFDHKKINEYIAEKYNLFIYDDKVDQIRAGGLVRYYIEKFGYEFSENKLDCEYPAAMHVNYKPFTTDEFRTDWYFIIKKCNTMKELEEYFGKRKWQAKMDAMNAPYEQFMKEIKNGYIADVKFTENELWDPYKGPRKGINE